MKKALKISFIITWSRLFLFIFIFSAGVTAFSEEYEIDTPEPGWINVLPADSQVSVPEEKTNNGRFILLNDYQVNNTGKETAEYFHTAYKIVNTIGLGNYGTISINYDPVYQKLNMHTLKIIRGANKYNHINRAQRSLLQREQNLEYQLYDGRKTLNFIIGDLRVGDIIEYSYSLIGSNPALKGKYSDEWYPYWNTFIIRSYFRIINSKGVELFHKSIRNDFSPNVITKGSAVEYIWDMKNLERIMPEENCPSWYFIYPSIKVSAFKSWQTVADWAENLYSRYLQPSESLKKLALSITADKLTQKEKAVSLIRFVQNEIRYFGIEMGPASLEPRNPETVIERRFGDCKDKAVLLTDLCRAIGIEAYPVLVNTYLKSSVADMLPSPNAFDHVITKIRIDNNDYWIDPTLIDQEGTLDTMTQMYYGSGLPVKKGADNLVEFDFPKPDLPQMAITEKYDISSGFSKAGKLSVETVYRNSAADYQRNYVKISGVDEAQKEYQAFYQNIHDDIQVEKPLLLDDDTEKNEFIINEFYTIEKPWYLDEKTEDYQFSLYPGDLVWYLNEIEDKQRKSPYAVSYPAHIIISKEILLTGTNWNLENLDQTVSNGVFNFKIHSRYESGKYDLYFEYRSLKDHVLPGEVNKYNEDIEKVNELIDTMLYINKNDANRVLSPSVKNLRVFDRWDENIMVLLQIVIGIGVLLTIVIIRQLRRRRRFREVYIEQRACGVCGRALKDFPGLKLMTCTACHPPAFYCLEHISEHQHRRKE